MLDAFDLQAFGAIGALLVMALGIARFLWTREDQEGWEALVKYSEGGAIPPFHGGAVHIRAGETLIMGGLPEPRRHPPTPQLPRCEYCGRAHARAKAGAETCGGCGAPLLTSEATIDPIREVEAEAQLQRLRLASAPTVTARRLGEGGVEVYEIPVADSFAHPRARRAGLGGLS